MSADRFDSTDSGSPWKRNWLPPIILIGAILIFWWRMTFLGLIPCMKDPLHLYENYLSIIPVLKLSREMLFHGQLPLWSPYSQGGMVLFADPQYTVAYPVTLILYLLGTAAHFNALILLHYSIGAISLYFLMLRLKVSPAAALCTAFIYVFSFPSIFGLFLANAIWPWQWLPLIMLLAICYLDTGVKRYCYLLALVWGLQMFIYIQSTFIMSFCLFPFVILYASGCFGNGRRTGGGMVRLLHLALAIGIGTLLAAVLLFPMWEYKKDCSYEQFSYKGAIMYSMPAKSTFEFLLSPTQYFMGGLAWVWTFYMGVVGVFFFLYALFQRRGRSIIILFIMLMLFALIMAIGGRGPLYYYFYTYFPGAKAFHAPCRFLWLLPISFSLVAGLGIDNLLNMPSRKRAAVTACIPVALLAMAIVGKREGFGFSLVSSETLIALVPYAVATIACVLAYVSGIIGRKTFAALVLCLIFVESYRNHDRLLYLDVHKKYAPPPAAHFLRTHAGQYRFFSLNNDNYCYPVHFLEDDAVAMLYPELSNYFRVYDIQARGPLHIGRYDRLIRAINGDLNDVMEQGAYHEEIRNYRSRVIDLFGVKYILSKGPIAAVNEVLYDPHGEVTVRRGETAEIRLTSHVRTEQVIFKSYLEMASEIEQGQAVGAITFWSGDRKIAECPLRAGVNIAEVFDLNDPLRKASVRHGKVDEWYTWKETTPEGKKLIGSFYKTALDISPAVAFDRIEIHYAHEKGLLRFTQVFYRPEDFSRIADETKRRFLPVFKDETYGHIIYENRDVLPRTFLVGNVELARGAQAALDRLLDDSFNMAEGIILEEAPPRTISLRKDAPGRAGDVRIVEYTPNRIEMKAKAEADCFLFISDVYYPGWESIVDGRRTKTYRADYAFRAVYLPAGEHTVVMRFRPKSVMIGGAVSLLALTVIVAGLVMECRKSSRTGTATR
jgi:hypothetical protein